MALLNILHFPDPRLRKVANPVTNFNDDLQQLIEDMLETMYAAPGIGLAATQVNVQKRVLVIDISEDKNDPQVFVNPQINNAGDETEEMEEGCLSVPGFFESVTRPNQVEVNAHDAEGNLFTLNAEGLLAVCIQHEIDHLDGKLFVDYLSSIKRQRIRHKLEKQQRLQM